MGSCAIQLAARAGATVYTTASSKNFEYCRSLGAKACFDYHDDDVEEQILRAVEGKTVVGAYHATGGKDAVRSCAKIVDKAKGKAIVVSVAGSMEDGIPESVRVKGSKLSPFSSLGISRSPTDASLDSRRKQHLGQRRRPLRMAQVPPPRSGQGHHRAQARRPDRGRGAAERAVGARCAEEGGEREEDCRVEHLMTLG